MRKHLWIGQLIVVTVGDQLLMEDGAFLVYDLDEIERGGSHITVSPRGLYPSAPSPYSSTKSLGN